MEAIPLLNEQNPSESSLSLVPATVPAQPASTSFIESNTVEAELREIKQRHIIPTYKDSTPLISHGDFVELTQGVVHQLFAPERIESPQIRVSHPILGRVPEAKEKPASELLDHEKTIYYERMAFTLELSSISDLISGHKVTMTVGGVRKYDGNSLRPSQDQHFKLFAGYQVKVCCNLCVWTDGLLRDVRVKNLTQLRKRRTV